MFVALIVKDVCDSYIGSLTVLGIAAGIPEARLRLKYVSIVVCLVLRQVYRKHDCAYLRNDDNDAEPYVVRQSPNPKPETLYPKPFTLHPAPFTLHPKPYTLTPRLCLVLRQVYRKHDCA